MPRHVERAAIVLAQRVEIKARQDAIEIAPVQHIELAEGNAAGAHLFHCALIFAAPGVGERRPVARVAARFQQRLDFARDRRAPIDQRAEHVEEQGFYGSGIRYTYRTIHRTQKSAPKPMPKQPLSRANAKPRKQPAPRLAAISLDSLTPEQQALVEAIKSGPRGRFSNEGPFAVYLACASVRRTGAEAPGHLRFKTSVPGRLSEFAILVTAQHWKAQYEWAMHVPMAEKQGVKPQTIRDIQAGRAPKSAPRDELAIYAFAKELYAKHAVGTATFNRVRKILGHAGTVELVGILGYYALVSMILNTFRMPLPEGIKPGFREPS